MMSRKTSFLNGAMSGSSRLGHGSFLTASCAFLAASLKWMHSAWTPHQMCFGWQFRFVHGVDRGVSFSFRRLATCGLRVDPRQRQDVVVVLRQEQCLEYVVEELLVVVARPGRLGRAGLHVDERLLVRRAPRFVERPLRALNRHHDAVDVLIVEHDAAAVPHGPRGECQGSGVSWAASR